MREAVIVSAVRTPVGRALKAQRAEPLLLAGLQPIAGARLVALVKGIAGVACERVSRQAGCGNAALVLSVRDDGALPS